LITIADMDRLAALVAGVVAVTWLSPTAVTADSTGTLSGDVAQITDKYIDVEVNRQITRVTLPANFTAVYSADGKTQRSLNDIKPGTLVRVAFVKSTVGNFRRATEIDIMSGLQINIPGSTP
jgi:hypothetical protein